MFDIGKLSTKINGVEMVVSVGTSAFSNPQEDLDDISKYETVQTEFYRKDSKVKLEAITKEVDLSEYLIDDIFNEKVYANVPLQVAKDVYTLLNKVEEVKPTRKDRKMTKKQSQKIVNDMMKAIGNKIYEMPDVIKSLFVGLLAKEHILLIGKHGEAKTELSELFGKVIEDGHYFSYQMKDDTFRDDLFGSLNAVSYLEEGKVNRTARGMIQDAHTVYIDEIFKANGSTLNGLLDLINERHFDNNGTKQKTPLISVVGSSNEFPDEEENLKAFYDRFILKHWIGRMSGKKSFMDMFKGAGDNVTVPTITLEELALIQEHVDKVTTPDNILELLYELGMDIRDIGVDLSTRRIKKGLSLLKAHAFIEGRDEVLRDDFIILENVFWDEIEDKDEVARIVIEYSFNKVKLKLVNHMKEANEIFENFMKSDSNHNSKAIEAGSKINSIKVEIQKLLMDAKNDKELTGEINNSLQELDVLNQALMDKALAPVEEPVMREQLPF